MVALTILLCLSFQLIGQNRPGFAANKERAISALFIDASTEMIRGNNEKAIEMFKSVISMDNTQDAAYYNLSRVLMETGQLEESIKYGRQAIQYNDENKWYYHILRRAYLRQGDIPSAIEVQESLLQAFPALQTEQLRLSELYQRNGDQAQALAILNKIENQFGASEDISYRKFYLFKGLDQLDEAIITLNKLIELVPEESRYYRFLYQTLVENGKEAEGIAILKQLLEEDEDNGFALLTLADYYKKNDQLSLSDEYLFRAFNNPDIDPEGKIKILEAFLGYAGQDAEALKRLRQLLDIFKKVHGEDGVAAAIQGQVFALESNEDSARVYLRQSLLENPARKDLWNRLLFTSFKAGEYQQLFVDSEEALEYFPNDETFLFFFGVSGSRSGQLDGALYALKKILKKPDPSPALIPEVHAEIGRIYHQQGKAQLSDESFQAALALAPEDDIILNAYAYRLSQRKVKLEEAEKLILKALDIKPDFPAYQDTYGWILYQMAKYQQAEPILKAAVEGTDDPEIYEHYGDVLMKMGKREEAIIQWENAKAKGLKIDLNQKLQENP